MSERSASIRMETESTKRNMRRTCTPAMRCASAFSNSISGVSTRS